jgi:hypothetical protein
MVRLATVYLVAKLVLNAAVSEKLNAAVKRDNVNSIFSGINS